MRSLRDEMGRPKPPERITQQPHEFSDAHLQRLARVRPDEKPLTEDLWNYTQDLRFAGEVQDSLLVHVLPFLLEAWRAELRGTSTEYGGTVEHLHPALVDRDVFERRRNAKQRAAASEFVRETILEEIGDQRGLAFKGADARPYLGQVHS